jgi:hypothetical protein
MTWGFVFGRSVEAGSCAEMCAKPSGRAATTAAMGGPC